MLDFDKGLILDSRTHSPLRRLVLILVALLFLAIYWVPASAANEILINEVELNPPGTDGGAEKVELYNPSSSAIDVSG